MSYDPIRRADVLRHTPAEKAIYEAMGTVEALPPDTRLTRAVIKLQEARALVADYVDGVAPLEGRCLARVDGPGGSARCALPDGHDGAHVRIDGCATPQAGKGRDR